MALKQERNMFEGLDDIDWQRFGATHIAVGMTTQEIPVCVRNMLHPDDEEREYAIACLLGEGQHLGMIGKATPSIIPFILEVLADSDYEQRGYLIMGFALMLESVFEWKSFEFIRLELQVYDEIRKGYPIYKQLINDENSYARMYAVKVFGNMQDHKLDVLSTLLRRLYIETSDDVRIEIIEAMPYLYINTPYLPDMNQHKQAEEVIVSLFHFVKEKGTHAEQVQFVKSWKNSHLHLTIEGLNSFIQLHS